MEWKRVLMVAPRLKMVSMLRPPFLLSSCQKRSAISLVFSMLFWYLMFSFSNSMIYARSHSTSTTFCS